MATKMQTIESRYREIIARQGFKWENCRVLVFGFKTEADAKAFHYETLSGGFPEHLIFDMLGRLVTVVVPERWGICEKYEAMAAQYGGEPRPFNTLR